MPSSFVSPSPSSSISLSSSSSSSSLSSQNLNITLSWLQPDETADVLLRRTRVRPLRTKQIPIDNFIKDGLIGGDLFELNGPSQSGKTEFCMAIVAQCILPYTHEGIVFGGECRHAIWLDTDGHFHILRFVTILETRIASVVSNVLQKSPKEMSHEEVQGVFGGEDAYLQFILQCLSRLSIHICTSPFQAWATIKALYLKAINSSQSSSNNVTDNDNGNGNGNRNDNDNDNDEPPFRIVVLDSVSAFAQASRGDIDRMSRSLEDLATAARITALFTTSRRHQPLLPVYQIRIEPTLRKNKAILEKLRGDDKGARSEFYFTINDNGIVYS